MIMPHILEGVGNTPLVSFKLEGHADLNVFAKLEACNPTGSMKDRAAFYILKHLLEVGRIDADTVILESTSGNFGISLAAYCRYYGLKFVAVIDPNITPMNEMLIRSNGAEVVKVTEPDEFGGYLITRVKKIEELQKSIKNSYWINQYVNPLNASAYYHTLGKEICFQMDKIDYIFLGVSSGGTITGVSQKIKENFPGAKVVAVDVEGSVIFGKPACKRFIPGIGSSIVPQILKEARIDAVVTVDELATIEGCHELLEKHNFFVGGSSGSVLAGIRSFFSGREVVQPVNVVTVFPDRGERYYDTLFNKEWCARIEKRKREDQVMSLTF